MKLREKQQYKAQKRTLQFKNFKKPRVVHDFGLSENIVLAKLNKGFIWRSSFASNGIKINSTY